VNLPRSGKINDGFEFTAAFCGAPLCGHLVEESERSMGTKEEREMGRK
jgi:hypothetical protein